MLSVQLILNRKNRSKMNKWGNLQLKKSYSDPVGSQDIHLFQLTRTVLGLNLEVCLRWGLRYLLYEDNILHLVFCKNAIQIFVYHSMGFHNLNSGRVLLLDYQVVHITNRNRNFGWLFMYQCVSTQFHSCLYRMLPEELSRKSQVFPGFHLPYLHQ